MQAQTSVPVSDVVVTGASEAVQLNGFELILSMITLLVLTAFVTSLIKWISLLYRGTRFFGDQALVPARPRARPYWNPALFIFFFGVLIVASMLFNEWATRAGWISKTAHQTATEIVQDVSVADPLISDPLTPVNTVPDVAVPETADPSVVDSAARREDSGDGDSLLPTAPAISVAQLLLSSAAMLAATIVTLLLAQMFRPQLPARESGVDAAMRRERPRFGFLPRRGDIALGLRAAWLILPPTMLLMGLVSVLQKYSHPVLDALKPDGPDAAPDLTIFAALFFTTAIITPLVEEFWFRGLLQGGLQRLADMATGPVVQRRTGTASSEAILATMPVDVASHRNDDFEDELEEDTPAAMADDPDASRRKLESLAARSLRPLSSREMERDFDTRGDWTPTAVWPILVTSLVFAVMHWGQGLAPIPLFFLSLGLGYLYRQTGSLVPSIMVHFTLNGFTMCVTLLQFLR